MDNEEDKETVIIPIEDRNEDPCDDDIGGRRYGEIEQVFEDINPEDKYSGDMSTGPLVNVFRFTELSAPQRTGYVIRLKHGVIYATVQHKCNAQPGDKCTASIQCQYPYYFEANSSKIEVLSSKIDIDDGTAKNITVSTEIGDITIYAFSLCGHVIKMGFNDKFY
jgi:hypothetical protein